MTSAMDDAFGSRPSRPDHPDFWILSSILLRLDAEMMEAGGTEDDKEAAFKRLAAEVVDMDSVAYVSIQRAIRALRITLASEMRSRAPEVARLAAVYIDGFMTGATFAIEKGITK